MKRLQVAGPEMDFMCALPRIRLATTLVVLTALLWGSPQIRKTCRAEDQPPLARPSPVNVAAKSAARIAAARAELREQTSRLSRFLDAGPSGGDWKSYLRWPALESQLANPAAPDMAALRAVHRQFSTGKAGLELPVFSKVRQALGSFLVAVESEHLANAGTSELPGLIRSRKNEFRDNGPADVALAQARVRAATAKLSGFLDRGGQNGDAWKKLLRWGDLKSQLASPSPPNVAALTAVHERLAADHPGLELPEFRELRHALRSCLQAASDASNPEARAEYERRIEALAAAFEAHHKQPREVSPSELGAHLGWLEERNQAVPLVSAIRLRFSQPTLAVFISRRFIETGAKRAIDESVPLDLDVQGMSVTGTARITGTISASLVPDEGRGRVQVLFEGSLNAPIRGSRGPIVVCAATDAVLAARQQVLLDAAGARGAPPTTDVQGELQVTGVGTSLRRPLDRVARRVVSRVAARKEEAAGDSASERMQEVLAQRMQQEVDGLLRDFNTQYLDQWRNPLLRHDQFPRQFDVRTTAGEVSVNILQAGPFQLGAPQAPPPCLAPGDVTLYLHESFVDNYAAGMLPGRTLSSRELREQFAGLVAGSTQPSAEPAPEEVTVTLADKDPVTLRIDGGVIKLTVRGKQFVVRDSSYPPMNMTLALKLERGQAGYRAVLVSEPEIVPPRFAAGEPRRYSARELAMRRILLNRVNRDLKDGVDLSRFPLPDSFGDAKELLVSHLDAKDGWLTLSANLPDSAPWGR